jgi:glycosyltransferase involved in cell wall biosynthesis
MRSCVEGFSYSRALSIKYDIVHIHWPEWQLGYSGRRIRTLFGLQANLYAIDVLRARGAKLVWTVHNLKAHDGLHPRLEAWFWERFIPRLDGYIALTAGGRAAAQERFPRLRSIPGFVIPHGHYRGEYPDCGEADARQELGLPGEAKVILFFGKIRPYKNVPALIEAFKQAELRKTVLLVAGEAPSLESQRDLQRRAGTDPRIQLSVRAIPHADVCRYFRAADLVVLPFLDVLNSGSALLSLSFNRPVLVPQLGAMSELAEEVGPEWVRTYSGRLTGGGLADALSWAVGTRRPREAPLGHLEWPKISLRTTLAYEQLLGFPDFGRQLNPSDQCPALRDAELRAAQRN